MPVNSETESRRIVEGLLPEPDVRKAWMQFLADSITHAHRCSHDNWGVAVDSYRIRLLVGAVDILVIREGSSHLILDAKYKQMIS